MNRILLVLLGLLGSALAQSQLPGENFSDPCKLLSEREVSTAMGAKLHSLGERS